LCRVRGVGHEKKNPVDDVGVRQQAREACGKLPSDVKTSATAAAFERKTGHQARPNAPADTDGRRTPMRPAMSADTLQAMSRTTRTLIGFGRPTRTESTSALVLIAVGWQGGPGAKIATFRPPASAKCLRRPDDSRKRISDGPTRKHSVSRQAQGRRHGKMIDRLRAPGGRTRSTAERQLVLKRRGRGING